MCNSILSLIPRAAPLLLAFCLFAGGFPAAAADRLPVAVLNLDRILKNYQPLQDQLEPLKREAKELEENAQLRQAEIETVATRLRTTQPGTPEFQRLQQEGLKLQNELRQFVETERQSLQKKEAAVLVAFQRRLDRAVSQYARQHGIQLVLRQQESLVEEDPSLQNVLNALNRRVLYQDDALDITEEILEALKAGRGATD
jgi:Skp family chaperone for outer membrane proteins